MRKTIKALLIASLILWLPLLAKSALSAPLTLSDAKYSDAMGSEIWGILTQRCEYTTRCGFDPAIHVPPKKPRR